MADTAPLMPQGDETLRATARSLLASVNEASIASRNGWLFFLALLAYFFIAAASVSHKDLLLNTPVVLPFLGIALRLDSFFLFAPLVLLFVHFGLLVQHVLLSRKILELDAILGEDESWRGKRTHPLRLEMHSYFYTQALAGSSRSRVFATFLHGMVWLSLVLLPVFLILYFQVTFLPYHNEGITWAHRIYLMVEIVILLGVGIFLRRPNANFFQAVWRTAAENSTNFYVTSIAVLLALFFSVCVATFPDEWIDRQMKKFTGWSKNISLDGGRNKAEKEAGFKVFAPTAYFFANTGHTLGGFKRLFHRNLIVVDEDLGTSVDDKEKDNFVSLRGRNLRYANLSRTNLSNADFTNALLENAVLFRSVLNGAKFGCILPEGEDDPTAKEIAYEKRGCAALENADFTGAELKGADLRSANSANARFDEAKLSMANFDNANLARASFESAKGARASFGRANLIESQFYSAQMQGANFAGALALGTNFSEANLFGTSFVDSKLAVAKFENAKLNFADLTLAELWSSELEGSDVNGTGFSFAKIWGPVPPSVSSDYKVHFSGIALEAPDVSFQDELKKMLTSNDLKPETKDQIKDMLTDKSLKGWKTSKAYANWEELSRRFSGQDTPTFKQAYTSYAVKEACDNVRVEPETTAGVIISAARGNFLGNVDVFLTEIKKPSCGVFDLISNDLREELLRAVDVSRKING